MLNMDAADGSSMPRIDELAIIVERSGLLSRRDQEYLMEVTGGSARSLDILARALHVRDAELQPTLQAIDDAVIALPSGRGQVAAVQ
jgi:hypothetical protein